MHVLEISIRMRLVSRHILDDIANKIIAERIFCNWSNFVKTGYPNRKDIQFENNNITDKKKLAIWEKYLTN